MQHALSPFAAHDLEDEVETWLPGYQLTHILHVASGADLDAVGCVLACMQGDRDAVDHWSIVRRGAVLDQRILFRGISERRVRALRERLAQLGQGLRVRLEHQCSRRQDRATASYHP